jgi:NAD+ synthase (glutamine-hydrolysing)
VPDFHLADPEVEDMFSKPMDITMKTSEEERASSTAYWLWDYLRRSAAVGFFLPISGGLDSSATLGIVAVMCNNVMESYLNSDGYNREVIENDLERLCGKIPADAKEMTQLIMHTCYMKTSNNSLKTRELAAAIADDIGCNHYSGSIEELW